MAASSTGAGRDTARCAVTGRGVGRGLGGGAVGCGFTVGCGCGCAVGCGCRISVWTMMFCAFCAELLGGPDSRYVKAAKRNKKMHSAWRTNDVLNPNGKFQRFSRRTRSTAERRGGCGSIRSPKDYVPCGLVIPA
jgi:hypothetical protein